METNQPGLQFHGTRPRTPHVKPMETELVWPASLFCCPNAQPVKEWITIEDFTEVRSHAMHAIARFQRAFLKNWRFDPAVSLAAAFWQATGVIICKRRANGPEIMKNPRDCLYLYVRRCRDLCSLGCILWVVFWCSSAGPFNSFRGSGARILQSIGGLDGSTLEPAY